MLSRITQLIHKEGLSAAEFIEAYNSVAKDYDLDTKECAYYAPRKSSEVIADIIRHNRDSVEILDMACGTGLVGEELYLMGFRCIDGYDPARAMLEEAKKKNVYRRLVCQGMSEKPLDVCNDTYDVISICGYHGNPEPLCQGFEDLIRILKADGHIVIVIRNANYQLSEYQENFKTLCDRLEQEGKIKKIAAEVFTGYHPNIDGITLHYQKTAQC